MGVGNKAIAFLHTKTGAVVVIELNTDGVPVTMTSILKDLQAIHSRQLIDILGKLVAPSQTPGMCVRVDLE